MKDFSPNAAYTVPLHTYTKHYTFYDFHKHYLKGKGVIGR